MYECVPGRLSDFHKLAGVVVPKFFEKHGIKQVGFWTTVIGESSQALYYMLQWDSLADREKRWSAFQADPEYASDRAPFMANGPMIANVKNSILTPTTYSAMK
jgi:hypothetical protein